MLRFSLDIVNFLLYLAFKLMFIVQDKVFTTSKTQVRNHEVPLAFFGLLYIFTNGVQSKASTPAIKPTNKK